MSQQGINTAYNKASKTSYKYLNYEEKRLIKINEELERTSNFLTHLWGVAPRKENGAVDWVTFEKENKRDYQYLIDYLKIQERFLESRNRLIKKYNLDENKILNFHMETQFRLSQSY